jgi:vitamin B12 transporter
MSKSRLLSAVSLTAFTAALGLAGPAHAQNETIVVTKSLETDIPQILARTGTQVDTISATTIKNGGYVDISQVLNMEAPGLYVASRNGPFDYVDVSFLGSRTSDVLWLVDGVRINNRLYAGTTPLDTLPAGMVERLELIQGGQSLFYGTQASAGTINIITKAFTNTPDGAITIGGDSNYGSHLDAYYRDGLGRSQFVVFASADISSGYLPYPRSEFQPSATVQKRGYHVFTGGAKYRVELMDDLSVNLTYEKNLAHLDYPAPSDVNTAFNQRSEDLLTAKVDYTPTENFQVFLKGYYHWWISHYTEFDNNGGGPLIVIDDHDHWGFEDRGLNAMARVGLMQGLTTTFGYDYQTYDGSDAVLVISPKSEDVHALFSQLEVTDLIPNANLAFGARYNMPGVGEDAFVWTASGQYDIATNLYVKGMVGTNFRLPTAEELFADDPNDELGNPNLKPERTLSTNVSVGGQIETGITAINWHVTGFYRETKDLIDLDGFNAATNQDVFGNVSGKVITRGIEVFASAPLSDDLSANADFTYAAIRASGSSLQFNRLPETVFKLGLDWHPMDLPVGANLTFQHVGDLHDTIGGGVGRVSYGDYSVVTIGTRFFIDRERRHRIGLNVNNLFDESYSTHLIRGTADATGNSYAVHDRGMPRTVFLNYTWSVN